MIRRHPSGPALALLITAAVAARAEADTVVLAPEDAAVPARVGEAVRASIRTATADLADVREDAGSRPACAGDAACLADIGVTLDAQRVIGCTIAPVDGKISIHCWLVEVASREVLGDGSRTFDAAEAATVPGDLVATLIILAAPEEDAPLETVAPAVATAEPSAIESAPVASSSSSGASGWSLGVHAGAVVPRGDLALGSLVGLSATWAVGAVAGLRVEVGLDWIVLTQQDLTFTSPPDYPRARADLIQSSHVVATWAGATFDLVELGPLWMYGGASLGIAINRSSFEAFNMTRVERAAAPLVAARVGARSAHGRLRWGLDLSWRETHHDLGDSGAVGEDTTSGLLVTLILGFSTR